MTTLCDVCRQPGACCSGFFLFRSDGAITGKDYPTSLDVLVIMGSVLSPDCEGRDVVGLPFLPLFLDKNDLWRFWCPNLDLDGRCGDHANRPVTCSGYEAGSNSLCCMSMEKRLDQGREENCRTCDPDSLVSPKEKVLRDA